MPELLQVEPVECRMPGLMLSEKLTGL